MDSGTGEIGGAHIHTSFRTSNEQTEENDEHLLHNREICSYRTIPVHVSPFLLVRGWTFEQYRVRRSRTPTVTLEMVRHVLAVIHVVCIHNRRTPPRLLRDDIFRLYPSFINSLPLNQTRMSPHTTSNTTLQNATCRCRVAYPSSGPVDYSRILELQQGPSAPCHCRYAGFHRAIDLLAKSLHTCKTSAFLGNR
jgi:hypothetical protein